MKRQTAKDRILERIRSMKPGEVLYYGWRYFDAVSEAERAKLCEYRLLQKARGLPTLRVTLPGGQEAWDAKMGN